MNEEASDYRSGAAVRAPAAPSDEALKEAGHKDHFLQLMFFQASDAPKALHARQEPDRAPADYAPLRHAKATADDRFDLPLPSTVAPVRPDSPAKALTPPALPQFDPPYIALSVLRTSRQCPGCGSPMR